MCVYVSYMNEGCEGQFPQQLRWTRIGFLFVTNSVRVCVINEWISRQSAVALNKNRLFVCHELSVCMCHTWIKGVPASFRSAIALNWNRHPYMSRTGCHNWVSQTSVSRTSVSKNSVSGTGRHNWVPRTSVSRTNVSRTVCVYVSRRTRIDARNH